MVWGRVQWNITCLDWMMLGSFNKGEGLNTVLLKQKAGEFLSAGVS